MKLAAFKRTGKKKSEAKDIRREGDIPAVLYGPKIKPENIFVKGAEFHAMLRKLGEGRLATTVFQIELEKKTYNAIIKDIQYFVTQFKRIQHVDFEALADDVPVNVNVPIQYTGVVDCAGIKLGGILRQVIRSVKVRCLPKHIPEQFQIDVKELQIGGAKRLSDIEMPKEVRPMAQMKEVAVVIAKR